MHVAHNLPKLIILLLLSILLSIGLINLPTTTYAIINCLEPAPFVGICNEQYGSQAPGNEICAQRTDSRNICAQRGSGETPTYTCCMPDPPAPEVFNCTDQNGLDYACYSGLG